VYTVQCIVNCPISESDAHWTYTGRNRGWLTIAEVKLVVQCELIAISEDG